MCSLERSNNRLQRLALRAAAEPRAGIPHGILVYHLFVDTEDTDRGVLASAVAASVAEGVGGYLWARGADLSAGSATTIATLGDYGLLEGLGFASVSEYYDRDRNRAAAASMLMGSAAGLAAGSAYYGYNNYPYYGDNTYYDDSYAYAPVYDGDAVNVTGADDAASCAARFRSYDPASGTYLAYDGQRYACP